MLEHIGRGRDSAESIGSLSERLGRPRRAVERELGHLVLSGVPIIACESGVYVAESPVEARQYAESLRGRIVAVQARITALETWAEIQELSGQEAFPWAA